MSRTLEAEPVASITTGTALGGEIADRLARTTPLRDDRTRRIEVNPMRRGPIVLATDGTDRGGTPVVTALLLGEMLDLPIEVVTVLSPTPTFAAATDMAVAVDSAVDEHMRRIACETRVRDYVARFAGGAAPRRIHVRFGAVGPTIGRFANDVSATIVVVGASPHRRLHHIVSGECAGQVLRSVHCPILSVPPGFVGLPKRIIVAVDFGPTSVRAVEAALLIVGRGGTVILTHVVPPPLRLSALNLVGSDELEINIHALFDELLQQIAPSIRDGVNVETRTIAGDALESVLALASDVGADLIAIGTHGQTMFSRLMLGGMAASILHGAEQAVLVAPPNIPVTSTNDRLAPRAADSPVATQELTTARGRGEDDRRRQCRRPE